MAKSRQCTPSALGLITPELGLSMHGCTIPAVLSMQPVTDDEAVDAFEYLSRLEGIIPAIESAHAVAYACKIAPKMNKDQIMVVTLSGRGDKDCAAIARYRGEDINE